MLAQTVADFAKNESPVARFRKLRDDPIGYDPKVWQKMGELGWRGEFEVTGEEPWAAEAGTAFEGMAFKAADVPEVAHPEDLEFQQRRHQSFSNITTAKLAKVPPGIGLLVPHACAAL